MKKIEKTKELTVVYDISDDAVTDESDLEAYASTLSPSHLVFDGDAVQYHVRPLSRSETDDIVLEVSCMHPGDAEEVETLRMNKMGLAAYNRACIKVTKGETRLDKYTPKLGSRVSIGLMIWGLTSLNPT